MTLLEEITSKCGTALLASRDFDAIAAFVSAGRKKPSTREIGNGTILEVLGLATGNALLDVVNTVPDFRYVKPLVEQGRLTVGTVDTTNDRTPVTISNLAPGWTTSTITAVGGWLYKVVGSAATDQLVTFVDFGGAITSTANDFNVTFTAPLYING